CRALRRRRPPVRRPMPQGTNPRHWSAHPIPTKTRTYARPLPRSDGGQKRRYFGRHRANTQVINVESACNVFTVRRFSPFAAVRQTPQMCDKAGINMENGNNPPPPPTSAPPRQTDVAPAPELGLLGGTL